MTQRTYPCGEFIRDRNLRFVATSEKRPPKKGEWYLSGAIVVAYRAPNDFTSAYHIAKPVEMETCKCCGGSGKVVKP